MRHPALLHVTTSISPHVLAHARVHIRPPTRDLRANVRSPTPLAASYNPLNPTPHMTPRC